MCEGQYVIEAIVVVFFFCLFVFISQTWYTQVWGKDDKNYNVLFSGRAG